MRSAPLIAALAVHAAAFGVAVHAISGVPARSAEPEFAISFAFRRSAPAEPAPEPTPQAPVPDDVLPPVTGAGPVPRVEPIPETAGAPPAAPAPDPVRKESWLEAVAGRAGGAQAVAAGPAAGDHGATSSGTRRSTKVGRFTSCTSRSPSR